MVLSKVTHDNKDANKNKDVHESKFTHKNGRQRSA